MGHIGSLVLLPALCTPVGCEDRTNIYPPSVEEKSYGQVFASAAEVLDLREGDCTEHSVLLVALCRARNIPARAAMGLVYSDLHEAFAYHMWTEVWTGKDWLSLDATRHDGRVGPTHLKMASSENGLIPPRRPHVLDRNDHRTPSRRWPEDSSCPDAIAG